MDFKSSPLGIVPWPANPPAPRDAARPTRHWLRALTLGAVLLVGAPTARGAATFNVLAFGADITGRTWSTTAIQQAIDACTRDGGGTVFFPPGRYRVAPVSLQHNVTLQFAKECFIDAPRLYDEYVPFRVLIRALGVTNVALRGPVVITGQGSNYWTVVPNPVTWYAASDARPVPLVQFSNCSDVVVDGITIVNAPSWSLASSSSTNVTIRNVTIHNDFFGPNSDGIDLCQSKNVLVTGCRVATGDDAIVIKNLAHTTPENVTRNIVVTNCDLISRRYGLKVGTESRVGIVEDILFTDCRCRAYHPDFGQHAGVALESVDGGILRNVRVRRLQTEGALSPIFIRLGNRGSGQNRSSPIPGRLEDILIEDLTAFVPTIQREYPIQIHGLPTATVSNIVLRNIRVQSRGGVTFADLGVTNVAQLVVPEIANDYPRVDMFGWLPAFGVYCRHARALTLENLELLALTPDVRPALTGNDVRGLVLSNVVASYPGIETRTPASLCFVTNSPALTLTVQTNLTNPPGGFILSTP